MMMTSSMVISSVLWMEGVGLGLARNIVQRYALETGSEQGFGIDEKLAHHCFGRPDNAAFDIAGRPRETGFGRQVEVHPLACTLPVRPARGIAFQLGDGGCRLSAPLRRATPIDP